MDQWLFLPILIHLASPQSRSLVIIVFARVVRLYVRAHFSKSNKTKKISSENNVRTTGETVWAWPSGSSLVLFCVGLQGKLLDCGIRGNHNIACNETRKNSTQFCSKKKKAITSGIINKSYLTLVPDGQKVQLLSVIKLALKLSLEGLNINFIQIFCYGGY